MKNSPPPILAGPLEEEPTDVVTSYALGKNIEVPQSQEMVALRVRALLLNYKKEVEEHPLGLIVFSEPFFNIYIQPVVEKIAASAEEDYQQIAELAIDCIFAFLTPNIRKGYTPPVLITDIGNFFDVENGDFIEIYLSQGSTAVSCFALMIGAGVATDSDLWDPSDLASLPEQHIDDLYDGASTYYNISDGAILLNHIGPVVKILLEHGNPHMVNAYFRLVKGRPFIGPGVKDRDGNGAFTCPQFPIFDPEKILPELQALNDGYGEVRSPMTELARLLIQHGYGITFIPGKEEPGHFNLHTYYTKMKAAIPDDDEKLGYAISNPYGMEQRLVEAGFRVRCLEITLNYPAIENSCPGGVEALEKWIDEVYPYIPHDLTIADSLIKTFAGQEASLPQRYDRVPTATLPEKNLDVFLEAGKEVTTYLRSHGLPYFTAAAANPKLMQLLEETPDEFRAVIKEAKNFAFHFHIISARPTVGCAVQVFESYLKNWGHPEFEQFVSALDVIHDHAIRQIEETPEEFRKQEEAIQECEIAAFAKAFPTSDETLFAKLGWPNIVSAHCILSRLRGKAMHASEAARDEHIINQIKNKNLVWPTIFGPYALEASSQLNDLTIVINDGEPSASHLCAADFLATLYTMVLHVRGLGLSFGLNPSNPSLEKDLSLLEGFKPMVVQLAEKEGPIGDSGQYVLEQMEQAIKLGFWKKSLNLKRTGPAIIRPREGGLHPDSWLLKANPATQMAATSAALIASLGLQETLKDSLPELREYVPPDAVKPLPLDDKIMTLAEEGRFRDILDAVIERNLGDTLKHNMGCAMPLVADAIQAERTRLAGLLPIGAKTETLQSVDPRDVRFVLDLGGLGNIRTTPFVLKHAGKSLTQPPLPSAFEAKFLHLISQLFGVVDLKNPQIQTTMAGRWSNKLASIVGASLILASYTHHDYPEGAWQTAGHDYFTGARMMLYDYGVLKKRLPFQFDSIEGRTDIVGRKDLIDLDWVQILGTFATHQQFKGPFAAAMQQYSYHFLKLLEGHLVNEHSLFETIQQARWVYQAHTYDDAVENHEAMIREIAEEGNKHPELEAAVRDLITTHLVTPLQKHQETIRTANPAEFAYLERY